MRRGTTPTHTFHTDVDLTEARAVFVTYAQDGEVIIERSLEDGVEVTEDTVSVTLTQEETLRLEAVMAKHLSIADDIFKLQKASKVLIQIRAAFPDGSSVASNIVSVGVQDVLKDGEI